MNLKLAKEGEVYRLYVEDSSAVPYATGGMMVQGTIIAVNKESVLFGWKTTEVRPSNAGARSGNQHPSYQYIGSQKDYSYGLTFKRDGLVHSRVFSRGELDGSPCKKCRNFCHYAEPNQEDGTFVCYSCRQRW